MSKEYLVPIIMGSDKDKEHAEKIGDRLLEPWGIPFEYRVASAHKTPGYVLEIMKEYESDPNHDIRAYITVAGMSNGLSGVVSAGTTLQVIACPYPSVEFSGMDILSSLRMPSAVPVAVILEPKNAADFVGRLYASQDEKLKKIANDLMNETYSKVLETDKEVRGVKRK